MDLSEDIVRLINQEFGKMFGISHMEQKPHAKQRAIFEFVGK